MTSARHGMCERSLSWVKETFCIPKLCITSSDALVIQLWEKFSTSSGQLFWARSIPGSIIGIVVLGSVRAKLASNSSGLLLSKLLVWDALFHKSTRNLQLLIWLLHSNMMLRLQPLEHATFFSSFAIFCLLEYSRSDGLTETHRCRETWTWRPRFSFHGPDTKARYWTFCNLIISTWKRPYRPRILAEAWPCI